MLKKYLLLLSFFLLVIPVNAQVKNSELIIDNWTFHSLHSIKSYPAAVPGTIQTDLYENGLIPDPFFGDNEKSLQWISDSVWVYETKFQVSPDWLNQPNIKLIFEGIDTYADVFLNDSLILKTNNMFHSWEMNVKNLLKPGINALRVVFFPPDSSQKAIPGGNRVYHRKAQYQFGWDWGPVLKTMGMWKPVKIHVQPELQLEDVYITQDFISENEVKITVQGKVKGKNGVCQVAIQNAQSHEVYVGSTIRTISEEQPFVLSFLLKNPRLWWCHGMGEAYLYPFRVELSEMSILHDVKTIPTGIRKIELVQEKDSIGQSFYFKLNGKQIFAKGANWVPAESFLPRLTDSVYESLINDAVASNMNMLRVWGGGIYENDAFYRLCDEKGILVWQDFMFACGMYPWNDEFLKSVETEAVYQVKRLRNHACLALWCGNNESNEGWHNWGWQKEFEMTARDSTEIWHGYQKLFHSRLPRLVDSLNHGTSYHASSPLYGWGRKESLAYGDQHYWGVWWGMEPFQKYIEKTGRFASEFGFQALPDMKTLAAFCDANQLYMFSPQLKSHQKHATGYETIETYMKRGYPLPEKLDDFVYVSQVVQADGMKIAMEAHRRAMPRCMGSLYWQFNDCWPVVSWSGIDYYGRWKALQYQVKRSFEPLIVSCLQSYDSVSVYIVNDSYKPYVGKLICTVADFKGKIEGQTEIKVSVPAFGSVFVLKVAMPVKGMQGKYLLAEFQTNNIKARAIHYFRPVVTLKLPKASPEITFETVGERIYALLNSKVLMKNVCLLSENEDAKFSDNYFDLLPGEEKKVEIKVNGKLPDIKQLKVRCMNVFVKEY
jgi:beta-mannosidase